LIDNETQSHLRFFQPNSKNRKQSDGVGRPRKKEAHTKWCYFLQFSSVCSPSSKT